MATHPELDHDALIQRLIAAVQCTACDGLYAAQDVRVLDDSAADGWELLAVCPLCGVESVILAFWADDPVLLAWPPDLAEVAAWRKHLADFDGDLRDLMRRI